MAIALPTDRATAEAPAGAQDGHPEEALMRFLIRQGAARRGQTAIQFHLSRITRAHRNPKHVTIAANLLSELLEPLAHPPFVLRDGDIVVLRQGGTAERLAEAVEMLRYLLSAEAPRAARSAQPPYSIYPLEQQYLPLLADLLRLSDAADRRETATVRRPVPPLGLAPPSDTGALLQRLNTVELAKFFHRHTVWLLPPGGEAPRAIFDEYSFSPGALGEGLSLSSGLADHPDAAAFVARAFDRHILTSLLGEAAPARRPIAITPELQGRLAADFVKFEPGHRAPLAGRIIVALRFADIWSDPAGIFETLRKAHDEGHGSCIDGVSHLVLPLANLHRLDADFVKLVWDDAMLLLDETKLRDLWLALKDCGLERVILAGCTRLEAVQFGLATNIRMFQGRAIDRLAHDSTHAAPFAAA